MALATGEERTRGHDAVVYVDDLSATYSVVKAGSNNPELTQAAVDVALWGYYRGTKFFWSYLRTDLNPADALTRDVSDLIGLVGARAWCETVVPPVEGPRYCE